MPAIRRTLLVAATLFAACPLPAQQPAAAPPAPAAAPADVQTLDGIIAALYNVISGDSGVARNWDRMRSLFHPAARLIPVGPRPGGAYGAGILTVEDYVTRVGPQLERRGFHEIEAARRTETYGQLVHVFSTYESRQRAMDARPFQRGINSIQVFNDGTRWWIMNVMWWGETPATPLPPRYLTSENH